MAQKSKESKVRGLIDRHFALVGETLAELVKLIDDYLADDREFKRDCSLVSNLEHEADTVRRDVEFKLFDGAFLPVFREDYISLVERLDKVANQAEAVSQFIVVTRPRIPDMIREELRTVARESLDCHRAIEGSLAEIVKDFEKAFAVGRDVQKREQAIDRIVWEMTKKVFKSDLEKAEKIHLKMLIDRIAAISNRIEDTADVLALMAIKRNV